MACGSECNQEVSEAIVAAVTSFCQNNQAITGDPVNVVTGAFLYSEQDVAIPSQRLFIALTRHYNNQMHHALPEARLHPFGPGWACSLGIRLEQHEDGTVTYYDDRAAPVTFVPGAINDCFVAPPGSLGMCLRHLADGRFLLRQVNGLTAEFDQTGRIVAFLQPGPRRDSRVDYRYDDLGRLISVTGAGGRGLEFGYDPNDFLVRETRDHSGRRWQYHYNSDRELVEVCDPAGRLRRYEYGEWRGLIATERKTSANTSLRAMRRVFALASGVEAGPAVVMVTNSYTSERRVHLQTDALGQETRFEYNPFTRTTAVTDPAGHSTVYCFDEAGSTTKVRRPSGATTEYVFDERRNLLAEINPLGNRTEYVELRDPRRLDSEQRFGRRAIGNRASYLQCTAEDVMCGYDSDGNRPLIRNALGLTTRFESFTPFGQPHRVILPDGTVICAEYDERSGLPLRQTRPLTAGRADALQSIETWDYDDFGNCVRHRSWAERDDMRHATPVCTEAFEYDEEVQQLRVCRRWMEQDGEGASVASEVRYKWDSLGRLIDLTSLRNETTEAPSESINRRFGYDILGRQIWEVFPDGSASIWAHDIEGHVIESFMVRDASAASLSEVSLERRLKRRRWAYDAAGREIQSVDPTGGVTFRQWDVCGRCTLVVDHLGGRTEFTYDRDGRLIVERTERGREIRIQYDATDGEVSRTDTLGNELHIVRDALGRAVRVSSQKDSSGPTTVYDYDEFGRVREICFPDATRELLSYDEFQNVIARHRGRCGRPPDSIELYEYDGIGRLQTVKVGSPQTIVQKFRYEYFGAQREIIAYDALGNSTRSQYDSEGALIRRWDAEGRLLQFAYDVMGRLVRRWSDDGSVDSKYSYECGDLLSQATEPGIQYRWEYDPTGRVLQHHQDVFGQKRTVHYHYDSVGRLSEKKLDDSWWVRFKYAKYASSHLPSEMSLPEHTVQLEYDSADRLIGEHWLAGGRTTFEYTSEGALGGMQCVDNDGGVIWEQRFEGDDRQRPVHEIRRVGSVEAKLRYSYDALNRLTGFDKYEIDASVDSRLYIYDEYDNRLAEHRAGSRYCTYAYDRANRVAHVTTGSVQRSYRHDRCGLVIEDGTHSFAYDAAHRLRQVSGPGQQIVEFYYSANGELVLTKNAGSLDRRFYDGCQEIVRDNASDRCDSFWSLRSDCLIAIRHNRVPPSRVISDSWGSVLGIASTGRLREYDPFGWSTSPDAEVGFGFGSKRYEPAAGLYFNRARFYDPVSGRFVQPDPKGLVDGPNIYRYARNNPIVFGDRSGFEARPHSQGRIADLLLGLEFTQFPGQTEGISRTIAPGFLKFRHHAEHYDAQGDLLGRSYIVGPGFLESRPHVEHYDSHGGLVGRTYIQSPGWLESRPHAEHYDARWNRLGRSYVVGPGWLESRPHIEKYDTIWNLQRRTYVEGPGLFESRSHLQHYDPNWGRVGRTYVQGLKLYSQHYA